MPHVRKHALKKRTDGRGWVIDPLIKPAPGAELGHIHVASLLPGAVRGNHVHPSSGEYILVWGGAATLAWEEPGGRVVGEKISGDELTVFQVPPGVAHAVTNTGDEVVYLIAYYFESDAGEWPTTEARRIA